ncbi:hypothetical protein BHM03_00047522 [Ensete ventricosum]|nr:hypothetical protein BHM03_00047522 [Ensete ventricosum]
MKHHELSLLLLLLPSLLLFFLVASSLPHLIHGVGFQPTVVAGCNGTTIAECHAAVTTELLVDSEIHRRFLQPKDKLTYRSLTPDSNFCNTGGKPYTTNCIKPRSLNHPPRGCSSIYECRFQKSSPVIGLH